MSMLDDLRNRFTPKTPAERERLKKIAVYTVLCLSCLVCIWLIFAPSGDDTVKGKANTELPDGTSDGMPDTKIKAYEQEDHAKKHEEQQENLIRISETLDSVKTDTVTMTDEIQSSADAYQAAQASLQDFYIPETSEAEMQVAELQAKIDELEAQNTLAQQQSQPNEMELMERSYQLASQYFGNGGQQTVIVDEPEKERKVMPVNQVNRNVVSSLSASADNTRSFSTAVGGKRQNFRNTIPACVASDQSVMDGQSVRLRTLEPMWIGNSLLPKNTSIVGSARLQGERLEITIESIEALGCIMEVDLSVYDSDGQEGINIPNSLESDALKEIGANMGSTVGSSINISTDVSAQLVSDVGKGLLNGVSQYLTKKVREVKVHLKAGHKVMLKHNEL